MAELGMVGVALQLVETTALLIATIKKIRDAPETVKNGQKQIEGISTLAERIRTNPGLADEDIRSSLESMLKQSTALQVLFNDILTPGDGNTLIVRFINHTKSGVKYVKSEDRIKSLFDSLQQEKLTLDLYINTATNSKLHDHADESKVAYERVEQVLRDVSDLKTSVKDIDTITKALMDQNLLGTAAISSPSLDGPQYSIPHGKNDRFTGRGAVLDLLQERVEAKEQRITMFGLGGIGKSNTLLQFAYELKDGTRGLMDTSIFWVSGDSRIQYNDDCRRIVSDLKIQGDFTILDPKLLFKEWLESPGRPKWLLLVDNVDNEEVFNEKDDKGVLAADALARFMPATKNGSIIFTTRNRKVAVTLNSGQLHRQAIPLHALELYEGRQMLQNLLDMPERLIESDLDELALALEGIPLAISQAAAYINANANSMSVRDYLEEFNNVETKVELLDEDPVDDTTRANGNLNPIVRTWTVSLSRIEERDTQAAEYLFFMACIIPKSIPKFLLPPARTTKAAREALGTLEAYSFITYRLDGDIDIHHLVHLVARHYIYNNGTIADWTQRVVDRLSIFVPTPRDQDMAVLAKVLPHLMEIAKQNHDYTDIIDVGNIYYNGAYAFRFFYELGKATQLAKWDWEMNEQKLGPEDPATQLSAMNYADILHPQRMFDQAEEIFRHGVEVLSKHRSPEHPEMRWCRCLLEYLEGMRTGDPLDKSELVLESLVTEAENLFGPDDVECAKVLLHLGPLYSMKGKTSKGVAATGRALDICTKVLGERHGWVIQGKSVYSFLLSADGKQKEAADIAKQSFAAYNDIAGSQRTTELLVGSSMAYQLYAGKDFANGKLHLEKALKAFEEQSLPMEDSAEARVSTMIAFHLTACLLVETRYVEAEKILIPALDYCKRFLTPDDDWTLRAKEQLGCVYVATGRFVLAEAELEEAIRVMESKPYDFKRQELYSESLQLLGCSYLRQGKHEQSIETARRFVELRTKAFGRASVEAINAQEWMARLLNSAGDRSGSATAWAEVLQLCRVDLAATHKEHLEFSQKFLEQLYAQNQYSEAIACLQGVLDAVEGTAFADDPSLLPLLISLSNIMMIVERPQDAIPVLDKAEQLTESTDKALLKPSEVHIMRLTRGKLLYNLNKFQEMEDLYKVNIVQAQEELGAENSIVVSMNMHYSVLLRDMGRHDEAEAIGRTVLSVRERVNGPEHSGTRLARRHLASTLRVMKKFEESQKLQRQVSDFEDNKDPSSDEALRAANCLGKLYHDMGGRTQESEALMERAYQGILSRFGPDSPITQRFKKERDDLIQTEVGTEETSKGETNLPG